MSQLLRAVAGLLLSAALLSIAAVPADAAARRHQVHRSVQHKSGERTHLTGHHRTARHGLAARRRHVAIDHSGREQYGKVSYYHGRVAGKRDAAASRTLPLGTKATVTNLANGKSADVEITDRGPYVGHRIIDVTPHVADKLGLKSAGVAPVKVTPLDVPRGDGTPGHADDRR